MPKIVCISDTHCQHDKISIPDGDILIHAGDSTYSGTIKEMAMFSQWWLALPFKHKIYVPGNHCLGFEQHEQLSRGMLPSTHILINQGVDIEGIKFWGSPASPEFCNWAYNFQRGKDIGRMWRVIPSDTNVLITHTPPFGILDQAYKGGEHLGCEALNAEYHRIKPRYHIFGHIHGGRGFMLEEHTTYINASICTEQYSPTNQPICFEYKEGETTGELISPSS